MFVLIKGKTVTSHLVNSFFPVHNITPDTTEDSALTLYCLNTKYIIKNK